MKKTEKGKRKDEGSLVVAQARLASQPIQPHHANRPANRARLHPALAHGPAYGLAHVAHACASSARLPSLPPDPTCQPHVAHARAPLRFLLAAAATWPRMSATPVHSVVFSTPMPNCPCDQAPTAVVGQTRGSRLGHGPVSLVPCSCNLTRAV